MKFVGGLGTNCALLSSELGSPTCMPILTVCCLTCIPSETGSPLLVGLTTRTMRFVVTDVAEIGVCKVIVLATDTADLADPVAMLAIEHAGIIIGGFTVGRSLVLTMPTMRRVVSFEFGGSGSGTSTDGAGVSDGFNVDWRKRRPLSSISKSIGSVKLRMSSSLSIIPSSGFDIVLGLFFAAVSGLIFRFDFSLVSGDLRRSG